jgi:hypothetical protein
MTAAQEADAKAKLGQAAQSLLTHMLTLWEPKDVADFMRGLAESVETPGTEAPAPAEALNLPGPGPDGGCRDRVRNLSPSALGNDAESLTQGHR